MTTSCHLGGRGWPKKIRGWVCSNRLVKEIRKGKGALRVVFKDCSNSNDLIRILQNSDHGDFVSHRQIVPLASNINMGVTGLWKVS
jgi:hypothetical protein